MAPTDVVALFPGSSSAKSETDPGGPCASLEEEDRKDNTEADAESGTDEHGGKAAIPLRRLISMWLGCMAERRAPGSRRSRRVSFVGPPLTRKEPWTGTRKLAQARAGARSAFRLRSARVQYLFVEQRFAHRACGARNGRDGLRSGLGGLVGHGGCGGRQLGAAVPFSTCLRENRRDDAGWGCVVPCVVPGVPAEKLRESPSFAGQENARALIFPEQRAPRRARCVAPPPPRYK